MTSRRTECWWLAVPPEDTDIVADLSDEAPATGSSSGTTPAATLFPIVAAIGIFGVVYGAAAQPLLGTWLTIASSIVIFSGTVQFTMVGLLSAGTGPLAILWAVFVVNVRNFALGGAVRPFLTGGSLRRVVAAWFLIDETVGLALGSPETGDRILVRSGVAAYAAWVTGSVIGVAGGATLGLEALAGSVFPVLFIGLAALMVTGAGALVRAVVGAGVTLGLLLVLPGLAGLAPVLGGLVAAIPGGSRE